MRNKLTRLGEYFTHRDVTDMSNLFYFHLYDQEGWHAYQDLVFRNEMGWTKSFEIYLFLAEGFN